MRRHLLSLALLLGAAACLAIESPPGGVASVSTVLLPWPAVVQGDTGRDSTGKIAPLRVVAFGTKGDTLHTNATFLLLDRGLHLVTIGGLTYAVGDSARSTQARIVGTVGSLQTTPESIYVTLKPTRDSLVTPVDSSGHVTDTLFYVPTAATDTLNTTNRTTPLGFRVLGDTGGIPGWVLSYHVDHAPPSTADTLPAAYVIDGAGNLASADTTDATGLGTRVVQLRFDRLQSTTTVDSIVVTVFTQYRGVPLTGMPFRFVVPVKFKGFSTS